MRRVIALICSAVCVAACSGGGAKDTADDKPYVASEAMQEKVERIVRNSAADPQARVMVTKETPNNACGFVSTRGDVVRYFADFNEDKAFLARGSSADDSVVAAKC